VDLDGGRLVYAQHRVGIEIGLFDTTVFERDLAIVYCDGIGCNASTKGAYKLAGLGFRAKELLGGIDWWRGDGHPVTVSHEPGRLLAAE